jgi:demethylmenaquinone methyltransferase/2-methoxy-6-polyprenyl-1,4-benzoquinol methylase
MAMFLRKSADRRDPLPVTMSGVRMGERVLQIGVDDPALSAAIAAKVGLSGHAAIAAPDIDEADRARAGAAEAGGLIDVQVVDLPRLPYADREFDAVVVHSRMGMLAGMPQADRQLTLQECRRVLRPGGRIVVIEAGERSGLTAMLKRAPKPDAVYEATGGATGALESAGFRPVRVLGDREGFRFVEGLNT